MPGTEVTYWYCEDCGAKGYERGDPGAYETHRLIGIDHRAYRPGGKCLGMHIRWGDESVWPQEASA